MRLVLVAGRSKTSIGLQEAHEFSDEVSAEGIEAIAAYGKKDLALVFDTTSADAHMQHQTVLFNRKIKSIDLTPSGCGRMIIPAVNIEHALNCDDISMVSCGGQAAIPVICSLTEAARRHGLFVDYVEMTTSVSTLSVGPATRINVDSYILHTEEAIRAFSGCRGKVILNINPAEPPVCMQNSISIRVRGAGAGHINWMKAIEPTISRVQAYAPGWSISSAPHLIGEDRLFVGVSVVGHGDFLPAYSGNLDIITAASVKVGEHLLCRP